MTNGQPPRDSAEFAALFMSGALSPDEQRQLLDEMSRNGDLSRELKELRAVVHVLAEEIEPIEPGRHVKEQLMHFVRERKAEAPSGDHRQIWQDWRSDDAGGLFTLRTAQGRWEETGVEGIQVRRLFVDRANDRMTAMFRMAPGTSYVPHVHGGPEECYVLEGDLYVGDELVLHAGDYQRASPGSLHGVQRTEAGCLLLVTCSLHDEPL